MDRERMNRTTRMSSIDELQRRLEADAIESKREWWTRYLKGTARFRGTPMADVRRHAHAWWDEHSFGDLRAGDRVAVAVHLLREPLTEDRLAGMLLLGEAFVPEGWLDPGRDLPVMARLFDDGHLADWNSVDWFCVKVLGPWMMSRDGPSRESPRAELGRAIAAWRTAPVLWRRRASAVAFVNLVDRGDAVFEGFVDEVLESCRVLVASDERFSQTGAGWVLRELSTAEPDRVRAFLERHGASMSREALNSASRKLGT